MGRRVKKGKKRANKTRTTNLSMKHWLTGYEQEWDEMDETDEMDEMDGMDGMVGGGE